MPRPIKDLPKSRRARNDFESVDKHYVSPSKHVQCSISNFVRNEWFNSIHEFLIHSLGILESLLMALGRALRQKLRILCLATPPQDRS